MSSSQSSLGSKVIIWSLSYRLIDNYIICPLSSEDMKKFHILLLWLTLSCGLPLHWVNNPEAEELFNFLNLFLKLPDQHVLDDQILKEAVNESDKIILKVLQEDQIRITLTFDE